MNTQPLTEQVDGNHYSKLGYQPIQLSAKLRFSYSQGAILKYVTRYKDKNGRTDLLKAVHMCQLAMACNDYSAWRALLRVGKQNKHIEEYAYKNNLKPIIKQCIYHISRAQFFEAETDIRALIYQEYCM